MSNPWAQSFEELRSPHLQEKMAKKDYDGDGKIETGTQEYMGSRDKAIKKAMGKKVEDKKKVAEHHQKDKDGNTIPHEDGTPSSVEEMAGQKKYGPDGRPTFEDPIKKKGFIDKSLRKLQDNIGKTDKAHYEPEGEVIDELNLDSQGRMKLTAADVRLNSGAYKKSLKDINNKIYSPVIRADHYEPEGKVVVEMDLKKIFKLKKGSKTQQDLDPTSSQKNDKLLQHNLGRKFDKAHYEPKGEVIEAVKSPKLDVKETGVKNKIEINPEIKTEAANAPVKK